MKFAHALKEALVRDGYPEPWVAAAVPYSQLKKCLKKAKLELESLGLDEATVAQLAQGSELDAERGRRGSAVELQYEVDGEKKLVPKLTLRVHFNDGIVTDVALSPLTRQYLESLTAKQNRSGVLELEDDDKDTRSRKSPDRLELVEEAQNVSPPNQHPNIKFVDVPLAFTAEFFEILYEDVAELDRLQIEQREQLKAQITALSSELRKLTRPSKTMFHKSDLYAWRKLFDLYLQGNIFFSTRELDHGKRTAVEAGVQLQWFQDEVKKHNLVFKMPASYQALEQFIGINTVILLTQKFQELNKQAVSKILKKYDKRTMLRAGKTFPSLFKDDAIMSGSIAKDLCAQVSTDLVKIVPQPGDHECPICSFIVYQPVRMRCGHVYCISCSIKLQSSKKRFCPMCREDVILLADIDNLDEKYGKWLEENFPKECREARIAIQTADGIEKFGPGYKHPSEQKCNVM